jgi:valyl-tRNA synthetase
MSIQLKLDASAMLALFPEGSEARLELQQTVINEVVRKVIDRELSATRKHIGEQCKLIVEQALHVEGLASKLWNGVKLSEETEKRLQSQARDAATTAVSKAMYEAMAPLIADMDARIKRYADGELQARLNVMAKAALRGALG